MHTIKNGPSQHIPVTEGRFYWTTWGSIVEVYRKKGGRYLYVCPPGGIELRISPRIAGSFTYKGPRNG